MSRVAAIDCGTNSIRLLVADLEDGVLVDCVRRMTIVRLGQGVDATGRLATEAIERTRIALSAYAEEISALGATGVRMVATSATRDASNSEEFSAMVERTLGVAPEVITGRAEAELSFTGAVRGLPGVTGPALVVDIGGGSTEFVLGHRVVESATSVDIGCVRMTERRLHSDPPTPDEVAAARADIEAAIDRAAAEVPLDTDATLVGVAGSVTTVAAIHLGLTSYQPSVIHASRVPAESVALISRRLLAMTRDERAAVPSMHPGRVDVIAAGALVLAAVVERTGAHEVVASEHDILDGIAWSVLEA